MKQSSSRVWRHLLSSIAAAGVLAAAACSSNNSGPTLADGGASSSGGSCAGAPALAKADYCKSCTISAAASPNSCRAPRTVDACCAFVQPPSQELARGTGLVRNSSMDPTLQLGCLDDPGVVGTPKTITLKGFVRLFSGGNDSVGVKIEIFKEGENGALGELVGSAVSTTKDSAALDPKPTYLKKCPDGGCTYRAFTYAGVPTETRLIIKTSDAAGGEQWAAFYDYNIFFANSVVEAGDTISNYQPAAVAATDINTVASAAGGFTVKQDKGLLAGEVHDCGDVRVSGATVDTDVGHEGDMFYFGENEADPLPDKSRGALGTSKLGLFGTLNLPTGQPIRISALGKQGGQTILLGSYTVQTFPGAVTALSFRGRRPWQK
ncbi:MAG TPA: hypothetical protein VLT33_41065 [Labilithrix sp.]|nr:hypothetical protein [Labilithrix sp.]